MTTSTLTITSDQTFWTDEQLAALQTVVIGKATRNDLEQLFHLCKTRNLDVFTKDVYAIARGGKMTLQVAIDALRKIAQRAAAERGCLIGNKPPVFFAKDGTASEFPVDGFVGVKWTATMCGPDGLEVERSAVLSLAEYAGNGGMWRKMPAVMIQKCAEAVALRALAPEVLGGIYSTDEIEIGTTSSAPVKNGRKVPVREAKRKLLMFLTEAGLEEDAAKRTAIDIWSEHGSPTKPLTHAALDEMLSSAHNSISAVTSDAEPFPAGGVVGFNAGGEGPYSLDDETVDA